MTGDIEFRVSEGKLVIEVPLDQNHGPSTSGKTNIVATSGGFIPIGGTNKSFSLTVTSPRKRD